jgi:2-hydroxychromene-2-carboxylate isomerase
MTQAASEMDFDVHWLPYQLNNQASHIPYNKMENLIKNRGMSREKVLEMWQNWQARFSAEGLPYNPSEDNVVNNTYQAHRLISAAYHSGGSAAQDKAVEVIFKGYYGEGRAPSELALLQEAALAAGLDPESFLAGGVFTAEDDAKLKAGAKAGLDPGAVLGDSSPATVEVDKELKLGRQMVQSGVPHYRIEGEGGKSVEFSGAQAPEQFLRAFARASAA